MFCSNCGKENVDNAAFCLQCGSALNNSQPANDTISQPTPQKNGKGMLIGIIAAIVSLVIVAAIVVVALIPQEYNLTLRDMKNVANGSISEIEEVFGEAANKSDDHLWYGSFEDGTCDKITFYDIPVDSVLVYYSGEFEGNIVLFFDDMYSDSVEETLKDNATFSENLLNVYYIYKYSGSEIIANSEYTHISFKFGN